MNISYQWLRAYYPTALSPEEIAKTLTSIGLEVGGIETYERIPGGGIGLVWGHVLEVVDHENSDHLHVTRVDIGAGEPLQIVCGAPNVAPGYLAAVATLGTKLGRGEEAFEIRKSKIRGVESYGMLCSESEIGVGSDDSGIILIPFREELVGTAVASYYELESDYILEVDITPNRVDATSHYGVARDLAARESVLVGQSLRAQLPEVKRYEATSPENPFSVVLEDASLSPRYMAAVISGLEVKESPEWLQERLKAIGLNPINNIVDITNYVLHEYGQPLHAYDLDSVRGGLKVGLAEKGSKLLLLDGSEIELTSEDLVISSQDNGKPLCLAGVMGGKESGVSGETRSIVLEVANFDPTTVRKSARRHGLSTDSSFRFERGLSAEVCPWALERAIDLIISLAGGQLESISDSYPLIADPYEIFLSLEKLRSLTGVDIPSGVVREILESLDISIISQIGDVWQVQVPRYRIDVTREVDLIEEILRIYGYDSVEPTGYITAALSPESDSDLNYRRQLLVSDLLVGAGMQEILCNSLSSSLDYEGLTSYPTDRLVRLLNPLSTELDVMRSTLLFGGLASIGRNLRRQSERCYFFEWGTTSSYIAKEVENPLDHYVEQNVLGLWITGKRTLGNWVQKAEEASPFELKTLVYNALAALGLDAGMLKESLSAWDIYQGTMLEVSLNKGPVIAKIGQVEPRLLARYDVKAEVYYAELYWDAICKSVNKLKLEAEELPKYPTVRRDLSLLLDESVSFSTLKDIAKRTEKKYLQGVELFDVYQGDKLPRGKKSYAVAFFLRDEEKTMSDKQIDSIMQKLIVQYQKQLGAELR